MKKKHLELSHAYGIWYSFRVFKIKNQNGVWYLNKNAMFPIFIVRREREKKAIAAELAKKNQMGGKNVKEWRKSNNIQQQQQKMNERMNEKRERNQCCPHTLQLVVYDISDKCSMANET